ncbi:hypothetical protein SAMN00790413_01576 [Deinococcus hopiensis KR-140]|uniref:Uncharacterized protein n=1 Tax=Deinococcus hopiensis KR-140 TaxID=695939 RepID=A0A1W1VGH8_9DEIO|nr:hypothetical protein SAMN00790413_01576 [Deinococcus hopiensis KR-140]
MARDPTANHADFGRVLRERERLHCPRVLFVYRSLLRRTGQTMTVPEVRLSLGTRPVYSLGNAVYSEERPPSRKGWDHPAHHTVLLALLIGHIHGGQIRLLGRSAGDHGAGTLSPCSDGPPAPPGGRASYCGSWRTRSS